MASTVTHALSASYIALTAFEVLPDERGYVLAALLAATAVDLDHLVIVVRDRQRYRTSGYVGQLHHARSPLHELLGLLIVGIAALPIYVLDPQLALILFTAFAIHIVHDWILGRAHPLAPFDLTEVALFNLNQRQKIVIDLLTALFFGGLWIRYLNVLR